MCFVFIREQTATCATYSINWLVFIIQMKSVYSAVRTGSLNKAVCASSLKVYLQLKTGLWTQSFEVFHGVVKTLSFGIWRSADWQLPTDVSETLAALIIRVARTDLRSPICPEDGSYGFIRKVRKLVQATKIVISERIITNWKRLQCRSCDYPNEWQIGEEMGTSVRVTTEGGMSYSTRSLPPKTRKSRWRYVVPLCVWNTHCSAA